MRPLRRVGCAKRGGNAVGGMLDTWRGRASRSGGAMLFALAGLLASAEGKAADDAAYDRSEALALRRKALETENSPENKVALAQVLLAQSNPASPNTSELREAFELATA